MELQDVYTYTGIGIVLILSIFIKIPKLELNVWGWLGKAIGKALNATVIERLDETDKKIDTLQEKLDRHIKTEEVAKVDAARTEILQFSDGLLDGKRNSKESFDQILRLIDVYERYCDTHTDYPNNQALLAIENIKRVYAKRLGKQDFAKPLAEES